MKKYIVKLSKDERKDLRDITYKGKHKSQKILNAQILLGCDEGEFQTERSTNEVIARVLGTSMKKIDRVKKRFVMGGIEATLTKKKGSRIYKKKADGDFEDAMRMLERLKAVHIAVGKDGEIQVYRKLRNIDGELRNLVEVFKLSENEKFPEVD